LVLEDKIVQRAVAMLLEAIYEPHFCEFSFGFRGKRSAHQALSYLRQQCLEQDINWIIDADIAKFFDTISWEELRAILQKRVNDGAILRTDRDVAARGRGGGDRVTHQEMGTPQRGTDLTDPSQISFCTPVLDKWFQNDVRTRMNGSCFLARFADDFVMGFQLEKRRRASFIRCCPKRFERFGLRIHPEKSRMVQFSRPYWKQGKGPGSLRFWGSRTTGARRSVAGGPSSERRKESG